MELRHLRSFLAVADSLHFGRAARALNLSQPALSMQIRALEEEVGERLFARNRRSVALTLAGTLFAEDARDILTRAEMAQLRAQRAGRGQVGILRVGFISTAAALLLPPVALEFRRRYPDVRLELENVLTADQIRNLQEKRLDVGFLRLPNHAEGLEEVRIHREPFVILMPERHPLAGATRLRLADLTNSDFVMYARKKAPEFHDFTLGLLSRGNCRPRIVQEAGEMYTLVSLVAAGLGVAVLPKSVERYRIPGVVFHGLPLRMPQSEIAVAIHRESPLPLAREFFALARSIHAA
jgi:DNA-binding transcriptional LysR family regulator